MAWLEDYLAGLGQQAAQVGGAAAPVAAQAAGAPMAAPASAQGPQEGLLELARNYQRYLRRSGHEQDPLGALAGPQRGVGETGGAAAPDAAVRLLTGEGGMPFSRTTQGPRAGRDKQSYDLGDGRQANVYYDAKGRRQVMVFRPQQQAGAIDPGFAAQITAKDPAALAFVDMVRRRQSTS